MSIDFRLPNITATDDAGKLQQMQSFLFQLVEQLNYAMKTVESRSSGVVVYESKAAAAAGGEDAKSLATFNSIKSLIIKSADIVNAYYESISKRLSGLYVAESDFGTYMQKTDALISATSTDITQYYTDVQQIKSDIEGFDDRYIKDDGYIKTGILGQNDDGSDIIGLEIGQSTEKDGEETFNQYARFTADQLTFYDSNGYEVAWISDKLLHIKNMELTFSFSMGGFEQKVRGDKTVVEKWVAGGDG